MIVIIMAGGLGKRMESSLPKVLHEVCLESNPNIYYPMLIHVIKSSIFLNPKKIFIIVGKFRNIIIEYVNKYVENGLIINPDIIEYIDQEIALGTGHAIKCTLPFLSDYNNENALILSGDVPLISIDTLKTLNKQNNTILITELENPFGCGRILVDDNKNIIDIVEEKDCNDLQKQIKFVNCGIYQINVQDLINLIPQITNNNKSNEYYLTDIIKLMINNNIKIDTIILEQNLQYQIKNVNTKKDLLELNDFIKNMSI